MILAPLLALSLTAAPQPPSPPPGGGMAYDATRETTLQGSVTSVDIQTRGPGRMVTLILQVDSTSWRVLVGPEEILNRQNISYAAGDALTVLGAPATGPEGQIFMARRITKAGATLTLLDAHGRPAGMGGNPPREGQSQEAQP